MTVKVTVNSAGIIIEAAPVVSKFIGQELRNISKWMNKAPGFRMERIDND